ncbi:hypothetical protein SAMN06269185_1994 [Natronoarchaeum philippinense]|uniref:Uncharacterized protein n=1 Tax=Natronoarchaeum philippinense TaxID=558529 RepID=A0A285NTY0_NATPI|nr:hypothetical protein [Natronoarchaeum philippinense]SNZ12954.1 hypothetical protein SAMN06269185_1994 [Natronoarchaeum philippinense]
MSPDRGVSTVLDVVACLLLVTAAVGVHVAAPSSGQQIRGERTAASVADVLTTSTAAVDYSVQPSVTSEAAPTYPEASETAYRRSAHGTLGELLAAAAVAETRVDGHRVVPHDEFPERVVAATSEQLAVVDAGVRVVARWEPFPESSVNGTVAVGPRPPPDADVTAATTAVSVTTGCTNEAADLAARKNGFDRLPGLFADCVVQTLFPPADTRVALRGQPPASTLAVHRYRLAADAFNASITSTPSPEEVSAVNTRLQNRLSTALEADVRKHYDDPIAAAGAASPGRVTITVRTWDR